MKRFLLSIILGMMCFMVTAFAESDMISVYLDAVKIEFDVEPQMIHDRTMVPIRAVFEKMGAEVCWDESTSTAICTKGNTVVQMTVDCADMYINGQVVHMDVSPVVLNGRTLAPARYVAESFGANVQWNEENSSVLISSPNISEEETEVILYAADGRTIQVFKSDVPIYKSVGWYETEFEAQMASYNPNNRTVYRTPSGKKYHFDPVCGGKNTYKITLEQAKNAGLSPCLKCAD